ncbi:MAG: glycine cleavage system protein GcvH [Bacillota bacterium]|jgi:glycine cleavage system H protein|nr:glycine cleavage system protein GcvH [Candidatus Fermentithermobacillaceae bacterium]HOA70732.1 glycine cleavage system protein GcvH [Bacillota bacterium]HOP71483.1 glycine cleavage system protein GcvH [Bacillota bacterium]HPT35666.1 glycine cleavage system protein GcvH [Bacillota bacterium]HPZ85113.1 glycine cleavage system protein GcvH [Bacillota bacterium]
MNYPEDLKYTKEHEWVKVENGKARVGITAYAQDQLGDVVFVELPEVGTEVKAGAMFGTVESVKAVSDVYAPVSGTIVEVNEALNDAPELVNEEPYEGGWMIVIEMSDPAELDNLMDSADYQKMVEEGGE